MKEKVVLAYSGGLDTSVAIKLLQEKGYEVITLIAEVGQMEDMGPISKKAEKLGVLKHFSIDVRKEFVSRFINPAIKTNALYEGKYPLCSALSRPLIVEKLVSIAEKEGATAVAHGCTGKGNDQVRFEVTARALNPSLKIIAPIRDWDWSRDNTIKYANKYGIPIIKKSQFSIDQNLWGRAIECGPLEDPMKEPPKEAFEWTVDAEQAPDKPRYLTIEFEKGLPVSLDGKRMDGTELIPTLNDIAGKHGVGRVDHIEDRVVGFKSRELYECPAALCLIEAHQDLEKMVLTQKQLRFKRMVDEEWATLVYTGLWVDPLRADLEGFADSTQDAVTGQVRVRLFKGRVSVVGRSSPYSLYDVALARYDEKSTFDQTLSQGFTQLWGLSSAIARRRNRKGK